MYISCHAWKRGPTELGIAGLQYIDEKVDAHLILQIDPNFDVSTLRKQAHFQMTAPIPEDSSQLGALVNELLGNDGDHPWDVHAVQVSYDFGQLWRWKVILDRFAFSAGNTIGITGGAVGMNNRAFDGPFGGEVWLNPGDPAGEDLADARNILIVWALEGV